MNFFANANLCSSNLDIHETNHSYKFVEKNLMDNKISLESKQRIILNARGVKYEVILQSLNKYSNSRLGKLFNLLTNGVPNEKNILNICDDFNLDKNEFYFNKDPFILNMILNLYSNNHQKMHLSFDYTCPKYLLNELAYWGTEELVESCCLISLENKNDQVDCEIDKEVKIKNDIEIKYDFGRFLPELREKLFNYMENPLDSNIGKVFYRFRFFCITLIMILF